MAFHSKRLVRSSRALIVLVLLAFLPGCTGGDFASHSSALPTTPAPPAATAPSLGAADTCDGYGAGGWSFAAEASDNDGLVLTGARLGPRQLAQEISVPYIEVTADWNGTGQVAMRRFELVRNPGSGHAGVGTALMTGDVTCQGSGTQSVSASAEYVVQGLPSGVTILVWQSYRFDTGTTGCEPSEKLPCNRFWPTLEWGANAAAHGFLQSVRIVQRLQFDPDSGNSVAADIFRDRTSVSAALTRTSVETLGRGALKTETQQLVISNGTRIAKPLAGSCSPACTWDSVHLTDRPSTSSPGVNPLDPTPGCSECVHVHWAWDRSTNSICHGAGIQGCPHVVGTPFTDGRPELVDGSPQTSYLSVVRYSPDPAELDPVSVPSAPTCVNGGYECLVNSQPLAQGQDVLFWDMTSTGSLSPGAIVINGITMATGDAAWPQLTSFKHGGDGSMFFAPARILTPSVSHLSVAAAAPADAIHYPAYSSLGAQERWVLSVRITYTCTAKAATQGPFWLALDTDRSALLNADPATGAEPGDPAYVTVRAGTTPTTGTVALGDTVTTMECQNSHLPLTLTTYIEFSRPPTSGDLAGLTLLGAPDGSADFTAWDPTALPAATSPPAAPSPQDTPDTDFQLVMKGGSQYNPYEQQGITMASTGGGQAEELAIIDDPTLGVNEPGLQIGPASGYLLPSGTAGSKSTCFGQLLDNSQYSNRWGPGDDSTLTWDHLGQGAQACVDSGTSMSLLTVQTPWDGQQIVVDSKTWACTPPYGESVC
jgi:hypothetical protein